MPGLGLPPPPKPFLGGFRSRKTRMEFHHASCQTDISSERRAAQAAGIDEATQTAAPLRTAATDTRVDTHTQVPRASWYADMSGCKVMEANGQHETAEQFMTRRHAAAATIQRWWQGSRGRQRAAALRAELAAAADAAAQEQVNARSAAIAAAEQDVRRRMQPRRPSDFQLLYAELGAWWRAETATIKVWSNSGVVELLESAAMRQLCQPARPHSQGQ